MHKKIIVLVFVVILLSGAGWLIFRDSDVAEENPLQKVTLKEAAKEGEKATHKLLVQIEPAKSEGRPERGDVLMVAAADRDFSDAEKEGFLIIKMELTAKQGELLMLSMQEKIPKEELEKMREGMSDEERENLKKNPDATQQFRDVKRRKFAVDLEKIGIGDDVARGKVIEDKIFKDDVLYQK